MLILIKVFVRKEIFMQALPLQNKIIFVNKKINRPKPITNTVDLEPFKNFFGENINPLILKELWLNLFNQPQRSLLELLQIFAKIKNLAKEEYQYQFTGEVLPNIMGLAYKLKLYLANQCLVIKYDLSYDDVKQLNEYLV